MAADEIVAAISTEATIRFQIILDEDGQFVGDMLLWMQNIQSDGTVLLLVTIRNYVLYVICTNWTDATHFDNNKTHKQYDGLDKKSPLSSE